jgi:hypothetical protein
MKSDSRETGQKLSQGMIYGRRTMKRAINIVRISEQGPPVFVLRISANFNVTEMDYFKC